VTWVLFDYAGVISLVPPPEAADSLAREAAVPVDDFWTAYWADRPAYDTGSVDAAQYWGDVSRRIGCGDHPLDTQRMVELDLGAWLHLNDETMELLASLSTAGVRLALLSNAPIEMAELINRQAWASIFERRYFSSVLRIAKPAPEAFLQVCQDLGAAPEDVVFVDDRQENIDAANALGMRAILFQSAASLQTAFAELLEGEPAR
jgi:putative hydrolase of the HAD superfamily